MRHVRWPLIDRFDVGYAVFMPVFLVTLIILAIFLRPWVLEFTAMGLATVALAYGLYPVIPGKAGWHKLLFIEGLLCMALLAVVLSGIDPTDYIRNLLLMAIGIVFIVGFDFAGATPYQKSELEPLLVRLGIHRLGFMNIGNTTQIPGNKVTINQIQCTNCGICVDVCPRGVYQLENSRRRKVILKFPEFCEDCEACVLQCPTKAIAFSAEQ